MPLSALNQANLERQPQPIHAWQVRRVIRDAVAALVRLHHHFIHHALELGDGRRVGVAAPVHQAGDAQAQLGRQTLAQVAQELGVFVQVLGTRIEVDLDTDHRVARIAPALHLPEQLCVDLFRPAQGVGAVDDPDVALGEAWHADALGDHLHATARRAAGGVDLALEDIQGLGLLEHRLRGDATPQPEGVIVTGVNGAEGRACQ